VYMDACLVLYRGGPSSVLVPGQTLRQVQVRIACEPRISFRYMARRCPGAFLGPPELELELIQSHMAQKPMLRGEVGARALRVRSDVRGHGQVRLCKALDCGRCGCLKPIRACCVVGSAFFLVAPPRGGCAMAPRDSGMCWKQFMMCAKQGTARLRYLLEIVHAVFGGYLVCTTAG
jgi:hypothetical protein